MGVGKRSEAYGGYSAAGKSLREQMWEYLDEAIDHINVDVDEFWTGVASAYAKVIVLFERPNYKTIDDVMRAAQARYSERNK